MYVFICPLKQSEEIIFMEDELQGKKPKCREHNTMLTQVAVEELIDTDADKIRKDEPADIRWDLV